MSVPEYIKLKPEDWLWATWRPFTPLTRPEPRPFTPDQVESLIQQLYGSRYRGVWDDTQIIPWALTPKEAQVWYFIVTNPQRGQMEADFFHKPNFFPTELKEQILSSLDQELTSQQILANLLDQSFTNPPFLNILYHLLGLKKLVQLLIEPPVLANTHRFNSLYQQWRTTILPYLTLAEREEVRETILAAQHLFFQPYKDNQLLAHPILCFAASVGGSFDKWLIEVRTNPDVVCQTFSQGQSFVYPSSTSLPTNWTSLNLSQMQSLMASLIPQTVEYSEEINKFYFLFGLSSPQLFEKYLPGTPLIFSSDGAFFAGFLAHLELKAIPWLNEIFKLYQQKIKEFGQYLGNTHILHLLTLVEHPAVVPTLLDIYHHAERREHKNTAGSWLKKHSLLTMQGALNVVNHPEKWLAQAAEQELKRLSLLPATRPELEKAIAAETDPQKQAYLTQLILTPPSHGLENSSLPADVQKLFLDTQKKLAKTYYPPLWLALEKLPRLTVHEEPLTTEQLKVVVMATAALKNDKKGQGQPLLTALKEIIRPEERATFAWQLCQVWQKAKMPDELYGVLALLGWWGDNHLLDTLTSQIKTWAVDPSTNGKAKMLVRSLGQMGTNEAFLLLHNMSQSHPTRSIKKEAGLVLEKAAQQLGLTSEQLADRTIPDCGLDGRGHKRLDYGARYFVMELDDELQPAVRDENGKRYAKPPQPTQKDDPELAKAALADWQKSKKQITKVIKVQTTRLEMGMITGRRWSRPEFETVFLKHPLMGYFARTLLWLAYTAENQLLSPGRVTVEQELVNVHDELLDWQAVDSLQLAHPFLLPPAELQAWSQLWGDYQLIQPFPQLGREIFQLTAAQLDKEYELTMFKQQSLRAVAVASTLDKLYWLRGATEDGGYVFDHSKTFTSAGLTAYITHHGFHPAHYNPTSDMVEKLTCWVATSANRGEAKALPLASVPPIILSELLRDLHILGQKAKL